MVVQSPDSSLLYSSSNACVPVGYGRQYRWQVVMPAEAGIPYWETEHNQIAQWLSKWNCFENGVPIPISCIW